MGNVPFSSSLSVTHLSKGTQSIVSLMYRLQISSRESQNLVRYSQPPSLPSIRITGQTSQLPHKYKERGRGKEREMNKAKPSGYCGNGGSSNIHYSFKRAAAMETRHILLRNLLFKNMNM
jgi:hypothetical protein